MNEENIIVKCDKCGAKNRIPKKRLHVVSLLGWGDIFQVCKKFLSSS